jgi:hypothetical protein
MIKNLVWGSQIGTPIELNEVADIVFATLAKSIPQISQAYELFQKSNTKEAGVILIEYFRSRTNTQWFFSRKNKEKLLLDFRSNFQSQIAKHIETADKLLQGKISWGGEDQTCGYPPNWLEQKSDEEYMEFLNRHFFMPDLGIAYWCTGNEKYAKACVDLISDFLDKVAIPDVVTYQVKNYGFGRSPWVLLNTGLRARMWLSTLEYIIDSPSITPEFIFKFLYGVIHHRAILRYLSPETHHTAEGNHYLMEMEGLFYISVMLPELKTSEKDKKFAITQLERCQKVQVLEDGVHIEEAPGYHFGCILWFAEPMILAEINNIKFSDEYEAGIKKMLNFGIHITRPDNSVAPFADSWPHEYLNYFVLADHLFGKQASPFQGTQDSSMFWLLGGNLQKNEVAIEYSLTAEFLKSYFFTMRSSWAKDALYLAIHNGGNPLGHSHADNLSIDVSAYGEPIIVEPGGFDYQETSMRKYFKSSAARSTIVLDKNSMIEYINRWKWGRAPIVWTSGLSQDGNIISVTCGHDGFAPVMCERQVMFIGNRFWVIDDKIIGLNKKNIVDIYFHFCRTDVELNRSGLIGAIIPITGDRPSMVIEQINGGSIPHIEDTWYSTTYGVKKESKKLRLTTTGHIGELNSRIIMIPFKAGKSQDYQINNSNKGVSILVDENSFNIPPFRQEFLSNDKKHLIAKS